MNYQTSVLSRWFFRRTLHSNWPKLSLFGIKGHCLNISLLFKVRKSLLFSVMGLKRDGASLNLKTYARIPSTWCKVEFLKTKNLNLNRFINGGILIVIRKNPVAFAQFGKEGYPPAGDLLETKGRFFLLIQSGSAKTDQQGWVVHTRSNKLSSKPLQMQAMPNI